MINAYREAGLSRERELQHRTEEAEKKAREAERAARQAESGPRNYFDIQTGKMIHCSGGFCQ